MRRSFGGGNGGFNGGGMLRSVARTVTRGTVGGGGSGGGLQEPCSSSSSKKRIPNSKNLLSLSSSSLSSSSVNTVPVSAAAASSSSLSIWPYYADDFEWVSVDDDEDEVHDVEFGGFGSHVPSINEVQFAVSALQQEFMIENVFFPWIPRQFPGYSKDACQFDGKQFPLNFTKTADSMETFFFRHIAAILSHAYGAKITRDMYGASSDEDAANQISPPTSFRSKLDWIEPSMQFYNSRSLQPHGLNRVYDAFYLLQTDRAVQRMVISLSSDKAVWDAVMNNDIVRELKESFDTAEDYPLLISDEDSDEEAAASSIVMWILDTSKAKATELFGTIMQLVNQLFKPYETEKAGGGGGAEIDLFEDKLRSSLLLTVMVLLIVVVGRASTV